MAQKLSPTLLFQHVTGVMQAHRQSLNEADFVNGDHGDHMVEIFQLAEQAARERPEADLSEALAYAGQLLRERRMNGSAQVYAHGLEAFSRSFTEQNITLDNLVPYVRSVVLDKPVEDGESAGTRDVLKSLVNGLAGWRASLNEQSFTGLDMGYLFELGITYMQVKQRGGSRIEILADGAATVSPLSEKPYRYTSGKLAIQAFLNALIDSDGLEDAGRESASL